MIDSTPTRRSLLKGAGVTGCALAAGCVGTGTDESPQNTTSGSNDAATTTESAGTETTLKIGILQPLSGDLQYYGAQSTEGFFTGLAYKSGTEPSADVLQSTQKTVDTETYDLTVAVRDTQFSPERARDRATELVETEDVDILFGCSSSDAAARVIETVVRSSSVPYIVGPAASARLTTDDGICHERVFRFNANTAMDAWTATRYIANLSDISSVYLFGADTTFGRAAVQNYARGLENFGVNRTGETLVPQGHTTWESLLQTAESAGADAIVGGFTVATLPNLFEAFLKGDYSYRLLGNIPTKATISALAETIRAQLGTPLNRQTLENAQLGPFVTRYHWNQYDNPINEAFRNLYVDAYGRLPDLFTAGSFTAASAIIQAVSTAEMTTPDSIRSHLRGMTVRDTPKGTDAYTLQTFNNQARSPMTMTNYVPTSESSTSGWEVPIQPGEPIARIGASETTLPRDTPGVTCSL